MSLGDHLTASLTVVQFVRYFGCLPCQEWLVEVDRTATAEKLGAFAVGGSADYQATWLREERGVRMPLLLDPEHRLRDHVDAVKPLGWRLADPRGAAAYVRSLRHGFKPQAITRDTVRSPGVVILDSDGEVRWSYIGNRIGDYPPINQVLDAASRL
ncbi:hypothetical protein UG56_004885 [Nocardioides luteus]|uniref:Alkyl hydroperoxide reductase n=1 Tax=Nocardioides luteus TaxID=1844 RepID=A0A1J4N980_9ACTN|nr:hypothetical protein UG56_004885 [Nocardioides luteus]